MSSISRACAFVAFLLAVGLVDASPSAARWAEFKHKFQRKYASPAEEASRRATFEHNMAVAAKHQARNPQATFGMNDLSDKTEFEMKRLRGLRADAAQHFATMQRTVGVDASLRGAASFPQEIDWRTKGAVTPVKNQAQCGDCWSFSTTGNIEGQWFLAGHDLVSLSEQELTSCDTTDDGCSGGLPWNAMYWMLNNTQGWITTESAYPFASASGYAPACSLSSSMPKAAQIDGVTILPTGDEKYMAQWVSERGPLSIGVDATSWQTYTGGIMTDCTSSQMDHAVLIVGYDLSASTPYWIIKNSWASSWGEEGYIRVAYGSNQCLLSNSPSSANVKKNGPAPPPTPAPPATPAPPVTPAPPSTGNFTQYVCPDWTCLDSCDGNTLPLGECLEMEGGGSAVAACGSSGLSLTVYTTTSCSGSSTVETQPVDQCLQDEQGSYIYNVCNAAGVAASKKGAKGPRKMTAKKL
jgi:C1A family cysteine protease